MGLFGRRRRGPRTRLFFATDVHGSERCFRKWLNAVGAYEADALILGGDMTGKLLVPLVAGADGCWRGEIHDQPVVARDEDELEELRRRIRMMGRYDVLLDEAEERELASNPERVGTLFMRAMADSLTRWVALAEERLGPSGIPAYVMLGNDDEPELAELLRHSDVVRYAEDGVCELPGGHEMISFGPSTPTPWNTPREISEDEIERELQALVAALREPSRAVFNLHCPPADTHLDQAPKLDAELRPVVDASGIVLHPVGSTAVRAAIERHQPLLGLHGHVHESPATSRIGASTCINPGSEYADGILRGAIVDLDDEGCRNWQLVQG